MFNSKRNLKQNIANYKIYWYRLIPYVIAECINHEWSTLKPLILSKKLTQLPKLYNSNNNWYILEGLDYFFLGRHIYSSDCFLFGDSLHLQFQDLSDEDRKIRLIEEAQSDINNFWVDFYNSFTIKNLINKIKNSYAKAITYITRSKK